MDVKKIVERWLSIKKALKKEDQRTAEKLADMAKKHSSKVFYNFNDPLEAAIFSVFIELQKQIDDLKKEGEDGLDSGLLLWQKNPDMGEEDGKSEKN
jgi:hypothetical protein